MRRRGYRYGDWGEARSIFRGLALKLRRVTEKGLENEAEAAVRRIRNNIFAQNYEHAPLSEWRKEEKEEKGLDPRTLMGEGGYVRSIESFKMGKGEYGIGIQDEEYAERGKLLEWGGRNSLGRHVPARPHFRVELERMRNGKLPILRKGIKDVLRGRQTSFDVVDLTGD